MGTESQPRPGDGADRVYAGLRRAIIEQELTPGLRLPEDAMAARFGVSRTIVRAALERLGSEGLVERANNRSARVAAIDVAAASDLLDVRQGLEAMVMQRLAGRLTAADSARLRRHVALEKRAATRDGPEAVRLSGEFHVLLAELTGSALLTRYISDVVSRSSLILTGNALPHSATCGVTEHETLIALLERKDVDAALASMRAHLAHVAQRAELTKGKNVLS